MMCKQAAIYIIIFLIRVGYALQEEFSPYLLSIPYNVNSRKGVSTTVRAHQNVSDCQANHLLLGIPQAFDIIDLIWPQGKIWSIAFPVKEDKVHDVPNG